VGKGGEAAVPTRSPTASNGQRGHAASGGFADPTIAWKIFSKKRGARDNPWLCRPRI
jgi:hypothetical protein